MMQPELNTKRLLLRTFALTDAADIQRMAGNPNIALKTMNIPHPYLDGMAEEWILSNSNGLPSKCVYAMSLKASGELIGAIGLTGDSEEPAQAELGYWLGEDYWGKGYCAEACKELIAFAFEQNLFSRIFARYLVSNPASGRVMEKAGMRFYQEVVACDRDGVEVGFRFYEIIRK